MRKHTPGPWAIENETDITGSENSPEIGCVGQVDIAHVYLRTVPGKTNANAQLIAAAPEMLDALIDAVNYYPHWKEGTEAPWILKARAAISTARGELFNHKVTGARKASALTDPLGLVADAQGLTTHEAGAKGPGALTTEQGRRPCG